MPLIPPWGCGTDTAASVQNEISTEDIQRGWDGRHGQEQGHFTYFMDKDIGHAGNDETWQISVSGLIG